MSLDGTWVKYFSEQFAPLSAERAGTWTIDLQRRFPHADDAEVIRAIRTMAEDPKCPPEYPKIKHLSWHLQQNRKEAFNQKSTEAEPCSLCHPDMPGWQRGMLADARGHLNDWHGPCVCTLGQTVAWQWAKGSARDTQEVKESVTALAHKVARWRTDLPDDIRHPHALLNPRILAALRASPAGACTPEQMQEIVNQHINRGESQ